MRKFLVTLLACAVLFGRGDAAPFKKVKTPVQRGAAPTSRLARLVRNLPPYGRFVSLASLGITIGSVEKPPQPIVGGYNFRTPSNIDRDATNSPAFKGKYPGLYLNQPLVRHPADVAYLFISDQPEAIRTDRLREDGTRGAFGIYAMGDFPRAASVRVLMDHTNDTRRPLRLVLLFVPRGEGALMVSQRGEAVNVDSVAAGHDAFIQARAVNPEPRLALHARVGVPVVDETIKPGQTAVVQLLLASSVAGTLVSMAVDVGAPLPISLAEIKSWPTMHAIVWREESARLKKFIDPKTQPRRYDRILNSFQHARGTFHDPDRVARVVYNARGWGDGAQPVRAYSLFESIPGRDTTPGTQNPRVVDVPAGLHGSPVLDSAPSLASVIANFPQRAGTILIPSATDARVFDRVSHTKRAAPAVSSKAPAHGAPVDNRGKYGGVEELRIAITSLPAHCHRIALLALNPNGTFGGRHYVTDGHEQERDTWFVPRPHRTSAGDPDVPTAFGQAFGWNGPLDLARWGVQLPVSTADDTPSASTSPPDLTQFAPDAADADLPPAARHLPAKSARPARSPTTPSAAQSVAPTALSGRFGPTGGAWSSWRIPREFADLSPWKDVNLPPPPRLPEKPSDASKKPPRPHLSDAQVVDGDVMPLLEHGQAALLWRGNAAPGDVIHMWTEPMANTSVYLWYLIVPLPDPN